MLSRPLVMSAGSGLKGPARCSASGSILGGGDVAVPVTTLGAGDCAAEYGVSLACQQSPPVCVVSGHSYLERRDAGSRIAAGMKNCWSTASLACVVLVGILWLTNSTLVISSVGSWRQSRRLVETKGATIDRGLVVRHRRSCAPRWV